MTWKEAFSRLDTVQDELEAARFALNLLQRALAQGEGVLAADSSIRPSHVRNCAKNLETTYLLRLFAEFEAVLRDYWAAARRRSRRTQMEILINRVAILCAIPEEVMVRAHKVRDYRNEALHNKKRTTEAMSFANRKSRLGQFLSFPPVRW